MSTKEGVAGMWYGGAEEGMEGRGWESVMSGGIMSGGIKMIPNKVINWR